MERISEVLFGLIMVLTFTGSLSVVGAGRTEIREMLLGALGCNLAWGIIDAIFYLMARFNERARNLLAYRAVVGARDAAEARGILADALPPVLASAMRPEQFEMLREKLKALPEAPERARLSKDDWRGALTVFLLVFASVLPVVVPFMVMSDVRWALRVSNGIAIVMLFLIGREYGREAGRPPWRMGLWMVLTGGVLVGLTIALGG